jgi:DNA-binding XRE family transcriptional regulator
MIHVTNVRYAGGHQLALTFDDGTLGVADLRVELTGPFESLRDPRVFADAFVQDGTVCWPNGLDLAPERLYALAHALPVPGSFEQAKANESEMSLRELRKHLHMSQEDLAAALKTTQPEVSRIEQGADYRLSTLRKIVSAYGGEIEVAAIVEGKRIKLAV